MVDIHFNMNKSILLAFLATYLCWGLQFFRLESIFLLAFIKDQENPNFSAFGTCGSLSNDPVFDPGRLGKRSDGTKITKLQQEVERVKKTRFTENARKIK